MTRQETDKYVVGETFGGILGELGRDWIRVLEEWPEFESSLDASQKEALKRALTCEVALIQAPPRDWEDFYRSFGRQNFVGESV